MATRFPPHPRIETSLPDRRLRCSSRCAHFVLSVRLPSIFKPANFWHIHCGGHTSEADCINTELVKAIRAVIRHRRHYFRRPYAQLRLKTPANGEIQPAGDARSGPYSAARKKSERLGCTERLVEWLRLPWSLTVKDSDQLCIESLKSPHD